MLFLFFQAEDGIRYLTVTGVQTCALPISRSFPGGGACTHPRARRARRAILRPHDFRGNGRLPQRLCASDRAAVGGAGLRTGRRDAVPIAMGRGLLAAGPLLVAAGGLAGNPVGEANGTPSPPTVGRPKVG